VWLYMNSCTYRSASIAKSSPPGRVAPGPKAPLGFAGKPSTRRFVDSFPFKDTLARQFNTLRLTQFVSYENRQILTPKQLARRARSGVASASFGVGLGGPS
ncbi:MAG: hypothetical protein ABFR47_09245, partial [Verrucomicrobiota bacterium]